MTRGYIPPSKSIEWATPKDLFDRLDKRFGFTLDVSANETNAKCPRFFTPEMDGLAQPWTNADGSPAMAWCNPPYGRVIAQWVKKARKSAESGEASSVLLVPARTDTKWFHEDVLGCELASVEFIQGRIKFVGATAPAPFPTMLVIFERKP